MTYTADEFEEMLQTCGDELNLRSNGFGDEGAKALAEVLPKNNTVTEINLGWNYICADGAKALAEALHKNNTITQIDLDGNEIGAEGAKALAKALHKNNNNNNNPVVTEITLRHNDIGAEGAKALAEALHENNTVTQINLGDNNIGDEGAMALAEALHKNNTITQINWSDNYIGADGAKALAEALHNKNSTVTEINLISNNIGAEGATALAEALQNNNTVTEIHLYANNIDDEGAEALAEALQTNLTLAKLNVENNPMGNEFRARVDALSAGNNALHSFRDQPASNFIHGYPSSNSDWIWTDDAVKAANMADGRVLLAVMDAFQKEKEKPIMEEMKSKLKALVKNSTDEDGSTFLHQVARKEHPAALQVLQFFIDELKVASIDLMDGKSRNLREVAIGNKNKETSDWAKKHGTFLGRYKIDKTEPVHESETCTVYFGKDFAKNPSDEKHNVAIKIMYKKENFDRELKARVKYIDRVEIDKDIEEYNNMFEKDHVVSLYRYHEYKDETNEKDCYCLILAKGTKSLHHIIDSERIAGCNVDKIRNYGKDLAQAIQHMHEKKDCIHGDIKPRNIVRGSDGDIKLIDLDASVCLGDRLSSKPKSTAYISPEVAKIEFRPNEPLNIDFLKNELEKKKQELQDMLDSGNIGEMGVLCSETQKLQELVTNASSDAPAEDLDVQADEMVDIWGFGITMYYLCTKKKHLFKNVNQNDDTLDDESEKARLQDWKGLDERESTLILPGCKKEDRETAINFFEKCLRKDKNKRFQSMQEVLEHEFFNFKTLKDTELKDVKSAVASMERNVISTLSDLDLKLNKLGFKQHATMKILKEIIQGAEYAPKLMLFFPETSGFWENKRISNSFTKSMKVVFVCPITLEVPEREDGTSYGYRIELPKEWVKKYGPTLLMSLRLIKFGFNISKAVIPIPDEISNTINTAKDALDKFNGSAYGTMYKFLMEQDELKSLSECMAEEGNNLKDMNGLFKRALEKSGNENLGAKQISELFKTPDPDFSESGLVLATDMNGVSEYVKRSVKMVYEEFGFEKCLKMQLSELEDKREELLMKEEEEAAAHQELFEQRKVQNLHDAEEQVLIEGYLEKKGLRNALSMFQKRYFVLGKDGTLIYYKDEEARNEFHKYNAGKSKTGLLDIRKGERGTNEMIFIFKHPKDGEKRIEQIFRTGKDENRETWLDKATSLRELAERGDSNITS